MVVCRDPRYSTVTMNLSLQCGGWGQNIIVKTGGLNGKKRFQGHRIPSIATAWLPTLTVLSVGYSQTQLWMS